MKNKHNAGFSLIEVLVAIVILAAIVVPTCSSLVLSHRMNAKTEELMQAQLDVSSAVETLMAEGIPEVNAAQEITRFPNVNITLDGVAVEFYYKVTVSSKIDSSVAVTTYIRSVTGG